MGFLAEKQGHVGLKTASLEIFILADIKWMLKSRNNNTREQFWCTLRHCWRKSCARACQQIWLFCLYILGFMHPTIFTVEISVSKRLKEKKANRLVIFVQKEKEKSWKLCWGFFFNCSFIEIFIIRLSILISGDKTKWNILINILGVFFSSCFVG